MESASCVPMIEDLSDATCRQQLALSGHRGAWNDLVARHNRSAILALLARGHRADQARDLVQAAWTRLWERRESLRRLELPGLVIRQALFFAADARRSTRAWAEERSISAPHEPEATDSDLDQHVLSRQQLSRIGEILRQQSPTAQRVFLLVHGGEGLSHAKVAARVGLSVQRVRQVMCELRQRLRAVVEET